MQWEFIVALVIAIPIILIPAALVWWLNLGWIFFYAREVARERRAAQEKGTKTAVEAK